MDIHLCALPGLRMSRFRYGTTVTRTSQHIAFGHNSSELPTYVYPLTKHGNNSFPVQYSTAAASLFELLLGAYRIMCS